MTKLLKVLLIAVVFVSVFGCELVTGDDGIFSEKEIPEIGGIYNIEYGVKTIDDNGVITKINLEKGGEELVHIAQSYRSVRFRECFGVLSARGTVSCFVEYDDNTCYSVTGTMEFKGDTAVVNLYYEATPGSNEWSATLSYVLRRVGSVCTAPSPTQ